MAKHNKVIKEQMKIYQDLQERYEEMNDYLSGLIEEHKHAEEDLRYLQEFVRYRKLEDDFRYFREHAHEEYEEDMPFSYLTL